MLDSKYSRRQFLGTSALGAVAGISALANPARAAAEAVGVKPADLPDLTIKEVKVYELDRRRMPGPPAIMTNSARGRGVAAALYGGRMKVASIVTNSGIEGTYLLEDHYFHPNWSNLGWLEYAKNACAGKSAIDLPAITSQWVPERRRLGQSSYASAIDNCLWDILGQAVGLPIYQILGAYRHRVLAYASTQHHETLEQFVEEVKVCKAQGFKAYKIHPPSPNGGHDYKLDIAVAKAVREAVGPDFTLMIDPVGVYTREEAIKVGHAIQDLGYVFYEDPLPTKDIEGLVELCRDLEVPVHIGEFLDSIYDFPEYLRRGATDAVRFIVDNIGGITGGLKSRGPFRLREKLEPRVFLLKLFPGMDPELCRALVPSVKGLVVEAFGAGNFPLEASGKSLLPVFEEARLRQIPIVVTSQAHRNGVDLSLYAGGSRARKLGALSAGDMTTEACVVKLMHALAYAKDLASVKKIFERDLAGERSG